MKRYEGMFLFDNNAAHEWPAVEQEVRRLYERIGAEMHACVKFDERKLAFEINRRKRGTYVLTYFDAAPDRIADLERDAGLSEMILRLLVLRTDKVTPERIAELQAWPTDTSLVPSPGDGRRHGDDYRYRRDYGPPRQPDARTARPPQPKPATPTENTVATAEKPTENGVATTEKPTVPDEAPSPPAADALAPATDATPKPGDAPIEKRPDETERTPE